MGGEGYDSTIFRGKLLNIWLNTGLRMCAVKFFQDGISTLGNQWAEKFPELTED